MARTTPADGDADEKIMIVTATSGDTGKAALAGFADAAGTGITVFYPQGRVSRVQELQMTTQTGSNVHVCAVNGNFDDAQSTVKEIFGDQELAERLAADDHVVLSSANSINVGRLVPQVVYYFSLLVRVAVGRRGAGHEARQDLQRHILERACGAVEQFHHIVVAERLDRGDALIGPLTMWCSRRRTRSTWAAWCRRSSTISRRTRSCSNSRARSFIR